MPNREPPSIGRPAAPGRLASVVISELVSNAFEHGRGQVVFRLQLDEGIVRGEVIDQGSGFEHEIRDRGTDEVSGRGLFLVEALTRSWGIHEGTTHVWFELAASPDEYGQARPRLGQDGRPHELD